MSLTPFRETKEQERKTENRFGMYYCLCDRGCKGTLSGLDVKGVGKCQFFKYT